MAEPFVGQVIAVGFNFAPSGWMLCDGSVVPISQFPELFNLIGTAYGGDGVSTFAVPDLRGRVALHQAGSYQLGQVLGSEQMTLQSAHYPVHSHALLTSTQVGTSQTPGPSMALGQNSATAVSMYAAAAPNTSLMPSSITTAAGGNQPHENRQPYQVINYIIACVGIYPSQ